MKRIKTISLMLVCLMLSLTAFNSCDWDNSPEPEHPLYVTYTITAGMVNFSGPDQLSLDIQAWIKENMVAYDKQVNYSTGEASEFAKTDAEAIKKYEEFLPVFKTYLNELKKELKDGKYGELTAKVKITFFTSAARTQGKDGTLKYEHYEFVFPE